MRRKRLRSVTPSDGGFDGLDKDTLLRSPLAKRKKLAAERSKFSKLKEAITVGDLNNGDDGGATLDPATPQGMENGDGEDDEDSDEEDGLDLGFDDDFLARELDEELG